MPSFCVNNLDFINSGRMMGVQKLMFYVMMMLCCVISTWNVSRASAQDIWAISISGIDSYVSTDSIRQTSDDSFYVRIKNINHPQDNKPESIAYFEDAGWSYDAVENVYFMEDVLFFCYDEDIDEWKSRSLNYTEYTPISGSEYAHAIFYVCVPELQKQPPVLHLAPGELQELLAGKFLSEFKDFGTDELQIRNNNGTFSGNLSVYRIAGFQGQVIIYDSDTAVFSFESDADNACYLRGIIQFFKDKDTIRLVVVESNFEYINAGSVYYLVRE